MQTEQTLVREVSSPAAKPRVRCAVRQDFEQLMHICRQLHAENGISQVDWAMVAAVLE